MARYRQFRRSSMHMHFKIAGAGHGDLTWFSGAQRSRESATSAKFAISGLQSGECNCSPFCILSWPREKNCSPYPWIYKLYVLKEIYQVGVRTARHGEETRHQTACKITPRASMISFHIAESGNALWRGWPLATLYRYCSSDLSVLYIQLIESRFSH